MGVTLLLLAALAAAAPPDARDPRLCLALQVPMARSGSAELDAPAQRRIDRFARGSPLEDPASRNALRDPRVRFAVLAPYGAMRGLDQNRQLTLERGEAIRNRMMMHGIPADRLHVVPLRDSSAYEARVGLNQRELWDWGYVVIEYPDAHDCPER